MAVGKDQEIKTAGLWGPQWRRLKNENEVGLKEMPYHIADEDIRHWSAEEEAGMPSFRKDIRLRQARTHAHTYVRNLPGSRSSWSTSWR